MSILNSCNVLRRLLFKLNKLQIVFYKPIKILEQKSKYHIFNSWEELQTLSQNFPQFCVFY